jgi:hypothetical protein
LAGPATPFSPLVVFRDRLSGSARGASSNMPLPRGTGEGSAMPNDNRPNRSRPLASIWWQPHAAREQRCSVEEGYPKTGPRISCVWGDLG